MKKMKLLLLFFAVLPACMVFLACGGSSSDSGLPVDANLVGQWEGTDPDTNSPFFVRLGSDNSYLNITVSPDSSANNAGEMIDGEKGTYGADGSVLTIYQSHDWDSKGEFWTEDAGTESMSYALSNGNTTLTVTTDIGNIVLTKGQAPAPDTNLTGTWIEEGSEDYDEDSTDEAVRWTVTLGSNGSFSMTMQDIDAPASPVLVEAQSGTYGVYRSVEGKRYFAATITSRQSGTDPVESIFDFSRLIMRLFMFSSTDRLIITSEGDDMVFERQGTDPAVPAPDTAVVGYWQGVEEDGGNNYDGLYKFNSDNTFEKILLFQEGTSNEGEMYDAMRGHYMANGGEMIIYQDQELDDSVSGWWASADDLVDMAYETGSTSVTVSGFFNGSTFSEMTLNAIPVPVSSSALTGTWIVYDTHDYDDAGPVENVRYTIIMNSTGDYSMEEYDTDNSVVVETRSGTYGVSTIGSVNYITLTITTANFYSVGTDESVYMVSRYEYVLDTAAEPDTLTISGEKVFEKQ